MLEQSMVVSRVEPRARLVLFPFAAALHAAILAAAMVAAVWNVRLPNQPPPMTELWVPSMPVGVPAAPPPLLRRAQAETVTTRSPAEDLAPTIVPQETVPVETTLRTSGVLSDIGDSEGSEDGVDGGVRGGSRDGIVGSLVTGDSGSPIGDPIAPVRPGAGVTTPVNILRVEPVYPELARRIKAEGLVIIECVISRDGSVRQPKIVRSAHPLLDQAALDAVRQWKYEPGRMQGRPVDVLFNLTVNFDLK